ncbi:MAG: radical SAM protein, partial [Saprospiraceae bacterium]|nr:radical SAM protein [Saprospiraceae bacterium]
LGADQPAERKFGLTRQCLEVFWKYRHPVSLITKNSLILRDLDLLAALAAERLVHVAISITTLEEELHQFLEPRTASVRQRLRTVETLTQAGIPVFVMLAPIIPGLNDHEIFALVKAAADAGVLGVGHTMVRLAKRKYLEGRQMPAYDLDLHEQHKSPQLRLF